MGATSTPTPTAAPPLPQPPAAASTAAVPEVSAGAALSLPFILICAAHFTTDFYSSTVGTLQPALVNKFSLSYAQAGWIGGVFMLSSSVTQLGFGLLADRFSARWLPVAGMLMAALALTSVGLAPSFGWLLAAVFAGGMGVAAFHPQSTTHAAAFGGARRGFIVAVFITSGTAGLAFGPPYFSAIVERYGLAWLPIGAIPALLIGVAALAFVPAPVHHESVVRRFDPSAFRGKLGTLGLHYALVVLRSVVQVGLAQFLMLYLTGLRGYSQTDAGWVLSLYFLCAAIGSFTGGALADRFSGRAVVIASMLLPTPFLILFLETTGFLSLAGMFVGTTILLLTIPVNVVMAQELVPTQKGTVTSLMMGFAWGIAGITFVPLIGEMADLYGLEPVLWIVVCLPVLGFLMSLGLPKTQQA